MGQSTEQLRREIEATRNGLGDTLEAIGDRVSPSRVVQRRKNRVTGALRDARDRVMGVGADTRHAIADGTHSVTASVKNGVADTAESAVESVRDMPHMATAQTQGSPITAGAIAFGVGFIAAAVFPSTRAEQTMASSIAEHVDPLKAEVSTVAHELIDHLKEPAMEAVGAVKDTAAEGAGLVQEIAKDAVDETKQQGPVHD